MSRFVTWDERNGPTLLAILLLAIFGCLAGAGILARSQSWPWLGPLLLFFGLLPLINAPFNWFSLGITRALLRRGLEREKWWPYAYAMVDAVVAPLIVSLLAVVMVIVTQTFDFVVLTRGGQPMIRLVGNTSQTISLFDGLAARPTAPEYWWLYALLLSAIIPSLVNLMVGGLALMRGIPVVSQWLYSRMPERAPLEEYDRATVALVLMFQWIIGIILGLAAQAALVFFIFTQILPAVGLHILDAGRWIAELNLPQKIANVISAGRI